MNDNEFRILELYYKNNSISWTDLREKFLSQPDFMDLTEDIVSSVNNKLLKRQLLTDLEITGNQTYKINELGIQSYGIEKTKRDNEFKSKQPKKEPHWLVKQLASGFIGFAFGVALMLCKNCSDSREFIKKDSGFISPNCTDTIKNNK